MEQVVEILKKHGFELSNGIVSWRDNVTLITYNNVQEKLKSVGYKIIFPNKLVAI